MRIIPVIDLLGGQVVHAIKGERTRYQPVLSVLCDSAEPVQVARAFGERLGLTEIYVADLDAIQSAGQDGEQSGHREVIAALAKTEKHRILLDAGVSEANQAKALLSLGVEKVVIGAETLPNREALEELPGQVGAQHLVFSLDMRGGKILSRTAELAALQPLAALKRLAAAGWREVILLDLERVGSGQGVDQELIIRARAEFPEISLLVGGGVTGMEELQALDRLGVAGALVATALHRGILSAEQVRLLR